MALFGLTDAEISKPKWLSTADAANAFFVSSEEAALDLNKAKGIKGPGWYLIKTKDTSDGTQRTFVECLVALSNASALNAAAGDAADDAVVGDVEFAFTLQPAALTVTAPAAASFTVTVSDTGTFQWQSKTGSAAYANVVDAGVFSGATTDTLAISDSTGLTGTIYRCVVINTATTAQITSKGAKLTVDV